MANHLLEILTDYCEKPPVLTPSESGSNVSCFWSPPEIDYEWELRFSFTIEKRGGYDTVTSVDFTAPSSVEKVTQFLLELRERIERLVLPFYVITLDHARLFIQRTIWKDMDVEFAVPPVWSCPMLLQDKSSGNCSAFAVPKSTSAPVFSDSRYSKYKDWLNTPPSFPGSVTRGQHPSFSDGIAVRVFLNDLKGVNCCDDMRCYFDECDMTNCILKASPHLMFLVFDKLAPEASPSALCKSLDDIGLLGLEYHLRFPADYPQTAPLVRVYRPELSGGFVLPSGAICTSALQPAEFRARHSFEGIFRGILYLQGTNSMRATKDRVYANEAEAHQTTFKWLADVHKEWQAKGGAQ